MMDLWQCQREMMELYQTSSNKLNSYITDHLLPNEVFRKNVQDAVDRICSFLKEKCSMNARVIKTVKGGSAGKGTTLYENSDVDLVIFLDCFDSYAEQAQTRDSVIKIIEQNLEHCRRSLAFQVDISPPRSKGELRRSLSLTIQSKKKNEAVEVDVLPAFDVLGQITDTYKPHPKVYIDLIHAGGKPGEFNTSFTELQRNFIKRCPAKCKDLLRLVKHWYKMYKKCLRETYQSSVPLPSKFALELLTIYAWEEGTGKAEQFNTAEGFYTVMMLLVQYQHLCIYWTEYYSLEVPTVGEYVKKQLRGTRPVIMDPADPTGNVARGKGWNLLAEEALKCLSMPCCMKGGEPVGSWLVQPAKPFDDPGFCIII
nr:PREDICTED: 2'-5'-oligoadenylate synthase 1 [Anolis carolinensis]|eukprot:XP_008103238.1 PREDICTED: 2'-5'-oligoadenylate synthase 1 [Anolis carolinensis]